VLITSYATFANEHKAFGRVHWHYVVLDEGHTIRNPETKLTLRVKELKTPHRLERTFHFF
jgi:SNF2 family DNA or RNA helicase